MEFRRMEGLLQIGKEEEDEHNRQSMFIHIMIIYVKYSLFRLINSYYIHLHVWRDPAEIIIYWFLTK